MDACSCRFARQCHCEWPALKARVEKNADRVDIAVTQDGWFRVSGTTYGFRWQTPACPLKTTAARLGAAFAKAVEAEVWTDAQTVVPA